MIPHYRRDPSFDQLKDNLLRLRAIADVVSKSNNSINVLLLDIIKHCLKGTIISVYIRQDRKAH